MGKWDDYTVAKEFWNKICFLHLKPGIIFLDILFRIVRPTLVNIIHFAPKGVLQVSFSNMQVNNNFKIQSYQNLSLKLHSKLFDVKILLLAWIIKKLWPS